MSIFPDRFTLNPSRLWKRYGSKSPWLDFNSDGVISNGAVKLELDWNQPFIDEMKKAGLGAENDEETVRNYLTALTLNMRDPETGDDYPRSDNHPNLAKDHQLKR